MLCLFQGNCGKRVQIRRTLLNVPDVVSIGLVWGSDRPDLELTTEVAKTIGTTLLLPDVSTVWGNGRLAPVLKTIFHQCVINNSSQSNSDGSVLKQSHQS